MSIRYKKSIRTIQNYFDVYSPVIGEIVIPKKSVNLIIDATFFSRRDGVLVVRAEKKNLYWKFIETERIEHYREALMLLEKAGCRFLSFTIDGRRGVREMLIREFSHIPIQHCLFHQISTIHRYISRKPKLDAGKELRVLILTLPETEKEEFMKALECWHTRWSAFLKEKTVHPITKRSHYTHRRLRSAYRSLKNNLPYLFTFQDYPNRNIPTTTNSCDGSFSHWKNKVRLHRGLKRKRRNKLISFLLENLN